MSAPQAPGGAGRARKATEAVTPRPAEATNRRLLRSRDAIDRRYAEPLDVAALARIALMSPAHFIRSFGRTFGESPHRYLQRRRIERAMTLLRHGDASVTDIAMAVGFSSPGTFGRTFTRIVGKPPLAFRRSGGPMPAPGCIVMAWTRPSSFGEELRGSTP